MGKYLLLIAMMAGSLVIASDDMTLADVLAKHAEARGGTAKLNGVKAVKFTGVIEFNGFEHPFEMVQAGNGRYRWQAEGMTRYGTSLELGKYMVVASDGKQAWVLIGTEEPPALIDLPPERLAYMNQEADPLGSLIGDLGEGQSRKLGGTTELDGRPAIHVEVDLGGGFVEHWYLDAETYLPFRMVVDMPAGNGQIRERVWYLQDYRAVDGVQFPHYMEREDSQFTRIHHVESVMVNPDVSSVVFSKPEQPSSD